MPATERAALETIHPASPSARAQLGLGIWPIPALLAALVAVHVMTDPTRAYDPSWLILVGNGAFISIVGAAVALIAARNYRATGRAQILLLGCAVLTFGLAAAIAAAVRSWPGGANLNVTIYNVGALLSASLHAIAAFLLLAGTAPEVMSRHRRSSLAVAYGGSALVVGILAVAASRAALPPFFVQGAGPTALRQDVLGTACVLFAFSSVVFAGTYLRTREPFLRWYACALAATAISLAAFFVQRSVGSLFGWTGRVAQYVGGLYFLASLVTAARSAHGRGTTLDHVLTASLSGAEETFRALAENVPDVIRRFDRDLRHLYVNAAGQRLYGRAAGAVVGRRSEEVAAGGRHAPLNAGVERVFRTGARFEVEETLATSHGAAVYQSLCVPEYAADGSVANVLVVSRDLTAYKRAEEALRASEERFRAIVLASSDVVYRMSADWTEMRQLVGRDFIADTDAPTTTWLEKYIHPDDQRTVKAAIADAIRAKRTFELEHRVLRADGTLGWTFSRAVPILDAHGAIVEWFGTATDVTARKRAELALADANARLTEADRRKDEFLGMLSHELRNPLAPIRNATYVLHRAAPASEQARRAQAVIERQAEHLTRLVDDLLDVTRIAHGKIELRRDRVELCALVRRAVEDFRPVIEEKGVALGTELPDATLWADADATRITQVVGNLLHNAAKFTRGGDAVTVSLAAEGETAVVRVRDTGIGIDGDLLPRIFDPFVQGERTLARTDGGLGLGLALVKGVAELHGGTVRAESAGSGKGAEFVVRLPLAPGLEPEARLAPRADRRATGRRVLVVDDNVDAADSLAELVRTLGHVAEVAYDGASAVEKVRIDPPNVVLCDVGLPGMSGHDVAQSLRALALEGLRLVAVTGYAQPEDVKRAMEAGFDAHVAKPCDPAEIERLLA